MQKAGFLALLALHRWTSRRIYQKNLFVVTVRLDHFAHFRDLRFCRGFQPLDGITTHVLACRHDQHFRVRQDGNIIVDVVS